MIHKEIIHENNFTFSLQLIVNCLYFQLYLHYNNQIFFHTHRFVFVILMIVFITVKIVMNYFTFTDTKHTISHLAPAINKREMTHGFRKY